MLVLSPTQRRRAGDLLAANCVLAGTLVLAYAGAVLLRSFTDHAIALNTIPLLVATLLLTGAAVVLNPQVTWRSLGLSSGGLPGSVTGVVLGAAACALVIVVLVLAGRAAWVSAAADAVRFDWRDVPQVGLAFLVVGAVGEELFLRGLLLQFVARALGPWAAVSGTSVAFALLHGWNPGVTALAQCNTMLFGLLFGAAVFRHRSLWLACGLHLGWNLGQVVLGANTSGITMRLTELNLELYGEGWLAGGSYGLEGGVLATGAAILLGMVVWLLPRRAGDAVLFSEASRAAEPALVGNASGRPLGLDDPAGTDSGSGEERVADLRSAR